jgi:alpha-beta hydrolase superfamily lysophospholipase
MLADVVRARARDGFELFGLIHNPEERSGTTVVFVHGLGANRYVRFTDALASVLSEAGVALVRGNLRDSDMLGIDESPQIADVRKGGGAYHRFEDSVLDLESWMSEAERRGYGRIVLFGHSLGSLKATHYLFRTGDPRVKGLVLASTADLVAMHEGRYTKQELADFLATARRLVAEGRGADLMPRSAG